MSRSWRSHMFGRKWPPNLKSFMLLKYSDTHSLFRPPNPQHPPPQSCPNLTCVSSQTSPSHHETQHRPSSGFRSTSRSCSASSAHCNTKCRPSKRVCLSASYAFSASRRDTKSRNANPRVRASNFLGRRTDFRCPCALVTDNH